MVEMMVAVGILGVVVAGVMETLVVQNRAYSVVDETTEAQQNLRAISYLIERDLRSTGFMVDEAAAVCGIDNTNAPDTLYVTDPEPIDPTSATSSTLGATVTSGYSASVSEKWLEREQRDHRPRLAGAAVGRLLRHRRKRRPRLRLPGRPRGDPVRFRESGARHRLRPDHRRRRRGQPRAGRLRELHHHGGSLVLVPAIAYTVDANSRLLRNGLALANDVEDFQVAYFIDSDGDGTVTNDDEYPGSAAATQDYQSRNTDHTDLREVRFNIVVRARTTDPTYSEGFQQATENRARGRRERRLPAPRVHLDGAPAERRLPRRAGSGMRRTAMNRRESGSALIITVLVMMLLGAIGLSALETVMRDQQVAGYQNRSSTAFYAAEAGVAAAKDVVRRNVLSGTERLSFVDKATPVLLGDTYLHPNGQPLYYGDPEPGEDAIQSLDHSLKVPGAAGSDMRQGMGPSWNNFALWKIRVAGQTPDGAVSKIEVVTLNQVPGGY